MPENSLPPITPEPKINKSGQVRRFDLASLNLQIDNAIKTLPENATGAIIGIVDKNGAHLAVVGRKKFDSGELAWTVSMTKPFDGNKLDYAGQVRWAW